MMGVYKSFTSLQWVTVTVLLVWIAIQAFALFFMNDMLQWPDARHNYIPNSLWHYNAGSFYPTAHNLYDTYIQAIGYVNYLVVVLHLCGSLKGAMVMNLMMNIGVIGSIFYIGYRFFNIRVACLSVILYCSLISNVFVPLYIMSDLPSLFFSLVGFCLALHKKWFVVVFGGMMLGVAHTMRPYEVAFLVALILYWTMNKRCILLYIIFFIPYFLVICGTGFYSKVQTGQFVTCSTTNGFGMLKIALGDGKTDAGNGIFSDERSPIYQGLSNSYTFAQKDSIWKERAKPGLKKKGLKYLMYVPLRVYKLYQFDSFFVPSTVRFNKKNLSDEERRSTINHKLYQLSLLWNNIIYYTIILLFFFSLFINYKSVFSEKGLFLIILFIMTFGFSVYIAEERYHYPCIFILCLWSAYGLETFLKKRCVIS